MVTLSWFNRYVTPQVKPIRHTYYDDTVKKHGRIIVHADGIFPKHLIEPRRPSESPKIQEYRQEIYVPVTKPPFTKVVNSLMKIRKSNDWSIRFDPTAVPGKVRDGETLKDYIEATFPKFTSITNWYFQIGLKQQLVDPNAKILVMPLEEVKDNEYVKPFPFIFNSEYVIDYEYDKYYVLKDRQPITFVEQGQSYQGGRYYVVTIDAIQRFDQYTTDKKYKETKRIPLTLGYIPVYDFKATIEAETYYQTLYDSRIAGMIPFLDEMAREYSDQQAEVVQHVHSTLWAHQPNDCKKCKGTGELIRRVKNTPTKQPCDRCHGNGFYPFNPFENLVIGKQEASASPVPSPPAGFITKDTSIVTIQMERIKAHLMSAMSAINMEFLAQTPLNQSGLAKEVDKEELNNFVHGIAEEMVEVIDSVVKCINDFRYSTVVPNDEAREKMLPVINVPEKFDLLGDAFLLDGLTAMKNAKVDTSIVNAAEIEYAAKRFSADPELKEMVALKLSLDPFAGVPESEITTRLTFNLVKLQDAVIHANIDQFIERAMEDNKDFASLEPAAQRAILAKYAEELTAELPEPEEDETEE